MTERASPRYPLADDARVSRACRSRMMPAAVLHTIFSIFLRARAYSITAARLIRHIGARERHA